jgi:hypothetical protein
VRATVRATVWATEIEPAFPAGEAEALSEDDQVKVVVKAHLL